MPAQSPAGCAATSVGAIKSAETSELAVLAAMSGPPSGDGPIPRPVTWEGQSYRLDLGAAERQRLHIVREKQEGAPLDVPLDLAAAAKALAADKIAIGDVEPIVTKLTAAIDELPRRIGRDNEETTPPGVPAASNARETLRKLTEELTKDLRNKDIKRVGRASEPLLELSDRVLADVLLSIAYAADVGDPDGTVLLAEDVSRRHDFGFNTRESETRLRAGVGDAARRDHARSPVARQRLAAGPRRRAVAARVAPPQLRARSRSAEADVERTRQLRGLASRS